MRLSLLFPSRDLQVLRKLGSGAFGDVYLVAQDNQQYAVKVSSEEVDESSAEAYASRNEIESMSSLNCENVVRLHEAWTEPSTRRLCLRLELCNAGDLQDFLAASSPLAEDLLRSLFAQLLIGLDHIHIHHFLHRDIKPENILLHRDDERLIAKIADFGMSKQLQHTDGPASSRVGTAHYFAPEMLTGSDRYTRKVDIWSLGVVFYQMMVNRHPFPARRLMELVDAVTTTEPRHPSYGATVADCAKTPSSDETTGHQPPPDLKGRRQVRWLRRWMNGRGRRWDSS